MQKKFSVLIQKKINRFNNKTITPSDKSISIRVLLLASQCIGVSVIKNLLESEDVLNCIKALKTLGVKIIKKNGAYKVYGNGLGSFNVERKNKIFVGNSGTTTRLLAGLLATHPGKFYLYGDPSTNKRDMSRIIGPLEKVGAFFYPKGKKTLPLTIEGTNMPLAQTHIEHLGSAQVKSCLLLAAQNTAGTTIIEEKKVSRNHTEILLKEISADIKIKKIKTKI
jgi:3-phosphoshikimate 1-carboxyvinyltransferase